MPEESEYKKNFLESLKEAKFLGVYHPVNSRSLDDLLIPMKSESRESVIGYFSLKDIWDIDPNLIWKFKEEECIGIQKNADLRIQQGFRKPIIYFVRQGYDGQVYPVV